MASTSARLPAATLAGFAARLFEAKGMRAPDAAMLADSIVWADLRGVSSHGVARLPMYLRIIDSGELDPKAEPSIENRAGALFVVEGRRCAGPVAMHMALDEAATRAKAHGVGLGIIKGTTHAGAMGRYVHLAAERGFAGIVINSGPPNMAYHGARVVSLATSPIAIGAPSLTGPVVLDMATAMIANGRLQQAVISGEPLPPGAALTKDGTPTTDAKRADILLPMSGPKGSGLSFMIECLTSILAAQPLLAAMIGPNGARKHVHNATIVLIDIAALRPLDDFRRDMTALAEVVKSLPRLDPASEILLPGERASRVAETRARDGVPVSAKSWNDLVKAAQTLGVEPPDAHAPQG